MEYLRVRNFEKFQHYKHRNPPWIRLYRTLLSDRNFYKLDACLKFQIIGMFLLASECDNKILSDAEWIQSKIQSVEQVDLQALLATGFIEERKQRASRMLATRTQLAPNSCSETDSSETDSSEIQRNTSAPAALGVDVFEKLWALYPMRDGKRQALRHFKATVKTPEDLECIQSALASYKSHLDLHPLKPVKNGSTWFNNWRDWYGWSEPEERNGNGHGTIVKGFHIEGSRMDEPVTAEMQAAIDEFRARQR